MPSAPAATPDFGRYILLEQLGSGGMAEVHLAALAGPFDAKKLVVLKRPHRAGDSAGKMFLDEARLAMRLNHPNVVQTYDVGYHDDGVFLAMEYLDGQPLQRVLAAMVREDRSLPHVYLARIAADALSGLHYAHQLVDYDGAPLHIVHRDVSPHNLFITYEGVVKVVDFGVAKATSNQTTTEVGAVKGKLSYMAPEHALEQGTDRRADIFAMGIVLWEMIARQRLLTGATSSQVLNRLIHMPFPLLSKLVPAVDPELERIVMRALERDRNARYQTAHDMREALEEYIAMTGSNFRQAEIGRFVSEMFADVRQEMATKIRAHMALLMPSSSPGEPLSTVGLEAASTLQRAPSASRSTPPPPRPRPVFEDVPLASSGGNPLTVVRPLLPAGLAPSAAPPAVPPVAPTKVSVRSSSAPPPPSGRSAGTPSVRVPARRSALSPTVLVAALSFVIVALLAVLVLLFLRSSAEHGMDRHRDVVHGSSSFKTA